jgi:hypothetical protein
MKISSRKLWGRFGKWHGLALHYASSREIYFPEPKGGHILLQKENTARTYVTYLEEVYRLFISKDLPTMLWSCH